MTRKKTGDKGSPGEDMGGYGSDWPKPGTRPKEKDKPAGLDGTTNPFLVMRKRGKGKFVNDPTTGPNA